MPSGCTVTFWFGSEEGGKEITRKSSLQIVQRRFRPAVVVRSAWLLAVHGTTMAFSMHAERGCCTWARVPVLSSTAPNRPKPRISSSIILVTSLKRRFLVPEQHCWGVAVPIFSLVAFSFGLHRPPSCNRCRKLHSGAVDTSCLKTMETPLRHSTCSFELNVNRV